MQPTRRARSLLATSLAAAAILGGCAGAVSARRAYERLPTDVPAAVSGEPAADTPYCLVHVRQRHLPTRFERHAGPAQRRAWLADVNEHQREVHEILRAFVESGGVDAVLAEGVYAEDPWDDVAGIEVDYVERLRAIDRATSAPRAAGAVAAYRDLGAHPRARFASPDEIADLADPRLRQRALAFAAVKYAPGAEYLLALQGRLRVLPAERWELIRRASGAYDRSPGGASRAAAADAALFDDREDEVLRRLVAGARPLGVVLFGGLHDFSDNVERWNSAHPAERIALVVVTPDSY